MQNHLEQVLGQQLLRRFILPDLAPQSLLVSLVEWWQQAGDTLNKETWRGFNSLVVLGTWVLWKLRNDIVFNGASPLIDRALLLAQNEADLCILAGSKGLSGLVAARPGG